MTPIPLGLVTVTTAGTPVALTIPSEFNKLVPASGQVQKIQVYSNPSATGDVYVKTGGKLIAILPNSAGDVSVWETPGLSGGVRPGSFYLDAATNGDGAYVTLWVE